MEKVLNQEQIDAMVRAARGGNAGAAAAQPVAVRWDARQASQIGREQAQAISALHEGFARNMTHSVGAYLRVAFTAALVSAEHLTYSEFLQRIPEVTYLATCKLVPVDAVALLQLDLAVAFPLIDVLLGGEGKSALPERQITVIEDQILETVMRIICRELQSAWQMLALQFEFEQRQQPEQVQHLMPAEEKTLSLSFELTVAESRGTLNLVFPAVVSNALLRKMSADWSRPKRRSQPDASDRLRTQLLQCPFRVELGMRVPGVPVRDLLDLVPGTVLTLPRAVREPASLRVAEQELFTAIPARRGSSRAAQVLERCRTESERNLNQ
ncbi:MAG TPA: FliM/FliN family flagellar motor switch protein [Terriglobales bacterium]|nr:FliM/FliN family flagellar motor switch protein [Terriglobales bacterium]